MPDKHLDRFLLLCKGNVFSSAELSTRDRAAH
jgi:hypothetical protein